MMQKTYLSREMTRAMSLDHPIGDPFGGPAYGERREPISAIISVGAMIGSGSAFAAATTTLGAVMAGVSFAGAALSLIGNITGNSTLSKIGMVAGLVGGVGMGADALLGGKNFTFSGGDAAGAPEWLQGAKKALNLTPAGTTVAPAEAARQGLATNVDATSLVDAAGAAPGGLTAPGSSANALNAPGGGANALNLGPSDSINTVAGELAQAPGSLTMPPGAQAPATAAGPGSLMDSVKGAGKGMLDFVKQNPGAAYMAGSAVSGVADWLSGKTDAEIAALQAQVGYADARAMQIQDEIAREKQRRANLNQGWAQVDTRLPVNQNVTLPMPWQQQQQAGLINGVRTPG